MNKIQELESKIAELETDLVLSRQIINNQRNTLDNTHLKQIYLMHLQTCIRDNIDIDTFLLKKQIKAFEKYFE